ncbi:MAG: hypothetical protein J5679_03355 [Alphaproteobacteria bacterium]|nr:hypothetical protein [Alphaproteobacteria bacterium]
MKKLLTFATIAGMTVLPAFAESNASFPTGLEFGLGLSASSGINGFVGYANKKLDSFWLKRLGVRLDLASTTPVKSTINSMIDDYMGDGIEVGDYLTITDGKIESEHMAVVVDFYPFGDTWFLGGWRISGGYVIGGMNVKSMLTGHDDSLAQFAGKEFEIWGTKYKYDGGDAHGTAKAKWDYTGPYFGTGFDLGLFSGFKIFMDAGVVFTSKAAELSMNVPVEAVGLKYLDGSVWKPVDTPALKNTLQENIDNTLADAQEKLDEYKFFPMVKLGFMYRF